MSARMNRAGGFYGRVVKRSLDAVLAAVALVLLAPVFAFIAAAIKATSRGPVFFTQPRAGQNGAVFKILKFRSMRTFEDSYASDGREMTNDERVTFVGKLLRRTSLDELPQLYNVLFGSMSVIGPRPALPYQVERYTEEQRERLLVRPGVTGLAQVNGRNSLTWEEKIAYDREYVQSLSLALDAKIALKTFSVVFAADDVQFTKHDRLSAHDGDLRAHIGERRE